ncbi:Uncharacterized protein OS=Cystobacter fuscus DSM 2262 GN=D187_000844 PE=4 SV=1: Glyoxalase_2 [Gemmata massiliana]|uniref:VOC domain-containing protein n=1 Tax=Gemmata massiliana TaxID=1210884 RepID=A0A6P2D1Y8_9BACT|nr:VOC family protein [Gemmata massiliana]VTR95301.1 Uncharacterized protein OS=Cystobacter fuscus DSM 2262 GN=D187_000844 PE=4 SV=1: Glyoxalase_2 [Gemmata massiliana]
MTDATTIPCLPCVSMAESLDFYRALGFEVTYQQKSPNEYAVVRQGRCEIHLFGLKGLKPENGYSTCCVIVSEVEPLHKSFSDALRQKYEKLPVAGFPRITRFKTGQTRFTVTDPNGNSVIFVKRGVHEGGTPSTSNATGLPKAIETAAKLRDESGDDESAAKVLDVALDRYRDSPALERWRPAPNSRSFSASRSAFALCARNSDNFRSPTRIVKTTVTSSRPPNRWKAISNNEF